MYTSIRHIEIVRWLARLAGGLLLLFWGAFFFEHLSWFTSGAPSPPAFVWLAQGAHLLLLVGYLVAYRWERVGSTLIIAGALLFFNIIGVRNAPVLVLMSIVPALLYLYCALADRTRLAPLP